MLDDAHTTDDWLDDFAQYSDDLLLIEASI